MKAVRHSIRILIVVVLLMPLAVSETSVGTAVGSQQSSPAEWPLARVEVSSARVFRGAPKSLYIEAASGVPLSKLIRLTVFGAFRPGLTIEEAKARFGPPVETRSDGSTTSAVYNSPAARIELVDELSGSGCVSYRRRTLYAYPKSAGGCGAKASDVFDAAVIERVTDSGPFEIGVAEAGDGERVWALVRDGCVEGLNWWAPASQGR